MRCKVYARTEVTPTEELNKVIRALSNIFNYDEIEVEDGYVYVTGSKESLIKIRESLIKRKIRSTARSIMIKSITNNTNNEIKFNLSKQAAFVGVPNFVEGELSPLGEIQVIVKADNIEKFIDWIAPDIQPDS